MTNEEILKKLKNGEKTAKTSSKKLDPKKTNFPLGVEDVDKQS